MRLNLCVIWEASGNGGAQSFYTSTDGGLNWIMQTGLGRVNLMSQACSADGLTILAGAQQGLMWRSLDGGATWAELPNSPYSAVCVTVSADGRRVAAQDALGVAYTSADGGDNWTAQPVSLVLATDINLRPTGMSSSQTLTASSDGSRLAGLVQADTGVWLTTSELNNLGLQGGSSQSTTLLYVGGGRWIPMMASYGVVTF